MLQTLVSSISPATLLISLLCLLIGIAYFSLKRNSSLPPGPPGLPFFGYWPFIHKKCYQQQFHHLTQKYGNVFSFRSMGQLYVCLGSYKAMHEAHVTKGDCFKDRPGYFNMMTSTFYKGLSQLNGEAWKVTRKFFLQSLKNRITESELDYIHSAVDELRVKTSVDMDNFLSGKCAAVLRKSFFSAVPEAVFRELVLCYAGTFSGFTARNMLVPVNIAKYVLQPLIPGYKGRVVNLRRMRKLMHEIIEERKSTCDEGNPRDLIDECIVERINRYNQGDETAQYFTDQMLVTTLGQMIGDGVLLTSAFMGHYIKCLLLHPEEQEKIYRELLEVVGTDRQTTLQDKKHLVYTNAFLQETKRTTDFWSFYPSMQCTKETSLSGYRIPKGAITVVNLYSANRDPETYKKSDIFDPSRFISNNGESIDTSIHFGVGKRSCVGEGFVMDTVFLIITTLVKKFRLLPPVGVDINSKKLQKHGQLMIQLQPRS